MEIPSSSPKNHVRNDAILTALPRKLWSNLAVSAKVAKTVAKDDPRRLVHGVKVAIAVCLVSQFYNYHLLYGSLGGSAMWAVLTVVCIFEFSVGETLGKGLNRMTATCAAGVLAVGIYRLGALFGVVGKHIIILLSAFIVASVCTFLRFIPELKARYDYGLMIFILTFCMVAVSSYGDDVAFPVAWKRLVTVIVGACIAMMVCVFICPVWIGEDLHNLIASNIDILGSFLEGFGGEYFEGSDEVKEDDKSLLVKYKSLLTTKNNEEIMANFARMEPGHGQFRFRHPWEQYLKIGTLTRQCANKIESLNTHLNSVSQVQPKIREHFKKICVRLSSECGKALKELSLGMKKMRRVSLQGKDLLKECRSVAEELKALLESKGLESEGFNLLDLLHVAIVASMLIEIETCTDEIAEAVHELDKLVDWKPEGGSAIVAPEEPDANGEYATKERASDKDNREGDGHVVVMINEVVQDCTC